MILCIHLSTSLAQDLYYIIESLCEESMPETTPDKSAREFLATRKTLTMGTVGANGVPTASYAPFVRQGDNFYVYTSALSRHTSDLKETGLASILLVEDKMTANNLFARKRITFSCNVTIIERGSGKWQDIINLFGDTFGKRFDIIRPLGDFTLFCLTPTEAVYVEGFGRAYRMNAHLRSPVHIKGVGPRASALGDEKN